MQDKAEDAGGLTPVKDDNEVMRFPDCRTFLSIFGNCSKETWDAEASLKTICAFANDIDNWGGGYLVIGVEEKGGRPVYPLKGVPAEKVDAYLKDMLNKCKRIQPKYLPIVEVVDYQGKKFIRPLAKL